MLLNNYKDKSRIQKLKKISLPNIFTTQNQMT